MSAEQLAERKVFKPNRLTFEEGLKQLKSRLKSRLDLSQIFTSKDEQVVALSSDLKVENVPQGFEKYQLPFFFEGGPELSFLSLMQVLEPLRRSMLTRKGMALG